MINGIVAVDLDDGSGIILELNNFLDFTQFMENTILVSMQARINNVTIDDVPKSLFPRKTSTQSIIFPNSSKYIPIDFNGPIPFIDIRYPTNEDMEWYEWIPLTDTSDWNPYDLHIGSTNGNQSDFSNYNYLYASAMECVTISAIKADKPKPTMSPVHLSNLWKISLSDAKIIIGMTTHTSRRVQEG